nr:MAG: hypothetical protein [Microvirus sp.]
MILAGSSEPTLTRPPRSTRLLHTSKAVRLAGGKLAKSEVAVPKVLRSSAVLAVLACMGILLKILAPELHAAVCGPVPVPPGFALTLV